ncbi:unnamed protein product, partial [Choristocarpus tenellus]
MHNPWTRKTRAWGFDVIRAIDADDAKAVIRAFKHPSELAFADLNTQVEQDYGGYKWTEWMHTYFGDTALHIAVKWKRHEAVKAILSLRPDWTLPNEDGDTAEDLCRTLYGKEMDRLKDEQELEYENRAMDLAEEEMRRRVRSMEKAEHIRLKLLLQARIRAHHTKGVEVEAALLLSSGRVFASEAAGPVNVTTARRAAHICDQLRRNRFAALRGEMRRNMLPTGAP